MWIRRHTNRLLGQLGLALTEKLAPAEQLEQARAKAQVSLVDSKLFAPFNRSAAYLFQFDSTFSDILTLISVMRKANMSLESGLEFQVSLLSQDRRVLTMEQFFLDAQQRYIAAEPSVALFKTEATAFLEHYDAIDRSIPGIPQFNHRVLSVLRRSVIETARALREFSHEK